MDILLAACIQHSAEILARSATKRSARAAIARPAAVALRMASGANRTTSGVNRLKRSGDAELTGDAAGNAKRSGGKRF
jgi:hypothetical protein